MCVGSPLSGASKTSLSHVRQLTMVCFIAIYSCLFIMQLQHQCSLIHVISYYQTVANYFFYRYNWRPHSCTLHSKYILSEKSECEGKSEGESEVEGGV